MIYVHDLMESPGAKSGQAAKVFPAGKKFSHMTADTEEELVAFAVRMGMKTAWLQNAGTRRYHFDITARRFAKILKEPNVQQLSIRDFVGLIRRR